MAVESWDEALNVTMAAVKFKGKLASMDGATDAEAGIRTSPFGRRGAAANGENASPVARRSRA